MSGRTKPDEYDDDYGHGHRDGYRDGFNAAIDKVIQHLRERALNTRKANPDLAGIYCYEASVFYMLRK